MSDQTKQIEQAADELFGTLRVLFPATDEVAELRLLRRDRKGGMSGFYATTDDGLRTMAVHAAVADADGTGDLYFGLNPRDPSVLALADHSLSSFKGGTDKTTARRRWLLVDADPKRAVKGGMATADEKKAAKQVMQAAVAWLCRERGWPAPAVLADSGNGYHCLWAVDLEPDNTLVAACLQALAARCDTPEATVDVRLGDAARICRLYGCMNRKGEDTPDRPHRRSKLKESGERVVVSPSLLVALANEAPSAKPVVAVEPRAGSTRRADAPTCQPQPGNGADAVQLARAWAAAQPPAVEGEDGSGRCFAVACGLLRDWGLSREDARPLMDEFSARCLPPWSDQEIEHKLDDAEKKAAAEPDRVGWRLRQVADAESGKGSKRASDADRLAELIAEHTTLWHATDQTAYATIRHEDGHEENYPVTAKAFQGWLTGTFYRTHEAIAKKTALADAVHTATGLALHGGDQHDVFVRIAGSGGRLYLDLGNRRWEAVEIDAAGWRVVSKMPVKFRRPNGQLHLPHPARGGSIEELRPFVPVASEKDFVLLVAFLVAALRPVGPYPVLVLTGRQGAGKSTLSRVVRDLLDPNDVALRQVPRSEQDFAIEAAGNSLVVFDNLSSMPSWLSDAICRLATGGGYAARTLYTDADQTILKFCRPAVLNGITDLATRGDLLERSILVELAGVQKRKDEAEFWQEFEAAKPRVLGALLDGVATALANLPGVRLDNPPRMADFAKWAVAAGPSFGWSDGEFLTAYTENVGKGTTLALEQYPFVVYLRQFAAQKAPWQGSATDLLKELNRLAQGSQDRLSRSWPSHASFLSNTLIRLAPALKAAGVVIDRGRDFGGQRERYLTVDVLPGQ
ncbi:MAG: hypothetical protein KF873_18940 [Gemmataceae bacterium]|nr:hypothetical protein [Gemmataceae bacterium]